MITFVEKEKAAEILRLPKRKFGELLPFLFYLSLPKAGVQLFPKEYLEGLKEHCAQDANTIQATRNYMALQEGPSVRALSHVAEAKRAYEAALAGAETLTAQELARLMCVQASRVETWVRLGKLKPEESSKVGADEVRFSKDTIITAFKWRMPPV